MCCQCGASYPPFKPGDESPGGQCCPLGLRLEREARFDQYLDGIAMVLDAFVAAEDGDSDEPPEWFMSKYGGDDTAAPDFVRGGGAGGGP